MLEDNAPERSEQRDLPQEALPKGSMRWESSLDCVCCSPGTAPLAWRLMLSSADSIAALGLGQASGWRETGLGRIHHRDTYLGPKSYRCWDRSRCRVGHSSPCGQYELQQIKPGRILF